MALNEEELRVLARLLRSVRRVGSTALEYVETGALDEKSAQLERVLLGELGSLAEAAAATVETIDGLGCLGVSPDSTE